MAIDIEANELGPVRPGQELDLDALEVYVRSGLDVDGPMEASQFLKASANLTYRLSFGN